MVKLCGILWAIFWSQIFQDPRAGKRPESAAPLVIGDTFTIDSKILGETRPSMSISRPPGESPEVRLPVLYMPDGGMAEIPACGRSRAGSVGNGTMRPFLLVGLRIPSAAAIRRAYGKQGDKKIAPRGRPEASGNSFARS